MSSEVASTGKDGFTLSRPFPYKNSAGDICCVVCCLQQGRLFYQAPCHFKIFRERGAIINEEREEWVTKVFGYDGLKDGRMCDKHYREMLKIKNGKGGGRKKKEGDLSAGESTSDNPDSCSSLSEPSSKATFSLFNCLVKELEVLVADVNQETPPTKVAANQEENGVKSEEDNNEEDKTHTSEDWEEELSKKRNLQNPRRKYLAKKVKREHLDH